VPEGVEHLERSFRLVTSGWLPGWLGVVVFAALGWFVVRQLRGEFAGVKTGLLVRRVLPLIRLLIVGTLVWLACRPAVQVLSRWSVRPLMLVQISRQRSMDVREEFGSLYEKIDALEAVEDAVPAGRNRAASGIARALERIAAACTSGQQSLGKQFTDAQTGLPLGPGLARDMAWLREELALGLDELAARRAELPAGLEDDKLLEAVALVAHRTDLVLGQGQALDAEADLVMREAARHPDILEEFVAQVAEVAGEANALKAEARDLQGRLDATLLGPDLLEDYRTRALRRLELAQMAAARITARLERDFQVVTQTSGDMAAALRAAFHRSLISPVAGVIYIGDGSAGLDDGTRRALSDLARARLPVHTVLVGRDGIRPHDIGLVSVDVPPIARAGRPLTVRALVQNALPPERNPRLLVRCGDTVLATENILPGDEPMAVVETFLVFQSEGRHSLAFEVVSGGRDAYGGNERFVTVVDVLPQGRRALIVSDRLRGELAAYQHVLRATAQVQVEVVVSDEGMTPIKVGPDVGEFPATPDEWQDVALAVLLGGVPEGLPDSALEALKQAVQNGLHVLVQGGAALPGERDWASALGLEVAPAGAPQRPRPLKGYWLSLYALARNEKESMALWRALPRAKNVWTVSTPGFTLLECDAGPAVGTVVRGSGIIVYNGLGSLASLRAGGNERVVNRLLYGLVCHALRPLREQLEDGQQVVVWPPQPVLGKRLSILGLAHPPQDASGLRPVGKGPAGEWIYEVVDENQVAFSVNGGVFRREVHKLLGPEDFELTPRADALAEMSRATGGRRADLVEMMKVLSYLKAKPASRSSVTNHRLWTGWWPLVVVLGLVSAEYLLRRRAGRVM